MNPHRILVTGRPGAGKTTLIRRASAELAHLHPVGFYTAEIREGGARKGFELVDLGGRRGLLSHVDIRSRRRVGKYGVDIEGFERFLDMIRWREPRTGLIVIDEIGRMECFSERFRSLVLEILDSGTPLLATIARTGGGLIAEIKRRRDVEILELTMSNRDRLIGDVVARLA